MAEANESRAATSREKIREKALSANARVSGFADFIRSQGVVGLAVGLVIGTQVKTLVDQLILSFIDPFLGLLIGGGGSLREKAFTFHLDRFGKTATFGWGAFVYVLIDFLIVAVIIYFVFKALQLDRLDKKKDK